MACNHNCESCGGCGSGVLLLSPIEYDLLLRFAEIPFYPAAFSAVGEEPICPDLASCGEDYGKALRAMEMKRLLSIDERIPLRGCDYGFAPKNALQGSIALTAYGQQVQDSLYLNGLE